MKSLFLAVAVMALCSTASIVQRSKTTVHPTANATWNRASDGTADVSPYVLANVSCTDICKASSTSSACKACTEGASAGATVLCTECWAVATVDQITFDISTSPSLNLTGKLDVELGQLSLNIDVGAQMATTIKLVTIPIYSYTLLGETVGVNIVLYAVVNITKAEGPATAKVSFSRVINFAGYMSSSNYSWTATQQDGSIGTSVSIAAEGDIEATVGIRCEPTLSATSLLEMGAYVEPDIIINATVSSASAFSALANSSLVASGLHYGDCTEKHKMEFVVDFALPIGAEALSSSVRTNTIPTQTLASGCMLPVSSGAVSLSMGFAAVSALLTLRLML